MKRVGRCAHDRSWRECIYCDLRIRPDHFWEMKSLLAERRKQRKRRRTR